MATSCREKGAARFQSDKAGRDRWLLRQEFLRGDGVGVEGRDLGHEVVLLLTGAPTLMPAAMPLMELDPAL